MRRQQPQRTATSVGPASLHGNPVHEAERRSLTTEITRQANKQQNKHTSKRMPLFCILNRSSLVRGSITPSWVDLVAASGGANRPRLGGFRCFSSASNLQLYNLSYASFHSFRGGGEPAYLLPWSSPCQTQSTKVTYMPGYRLPNNLAISSHSHFVTRLTET